MPPGTQDAERLDSRFTDEDADAAKGSLLDSDDDEEEIHACLHTGIEPLGVLTISTHGRGDLLPGSVKVTSDRPIGGFLRFSLPDIGVAGVGAGHPVRDALFPARRQAGGISTAAAIHNLGVRSNGGDLPIDASGHRARRNRDPSGGQRTGVPVHRRDVHLHRCRCVGLRGVGALHGADAREGMFTGVAVEIDEGNRILTTLPVVPVESAADSQE